MTTTTVTAGTLVSVDINQGTRDAEVVAVVGEQALLEYVMPKGTTALCVVDAVTLLPTYGKSNLSYRQLLTSRKWRDAVQAQYGLHNLLCEPQGCGRALPAVLRQQFRALADAADNETLARLAGITPVQQQQ
jgi:hypothetical protein